MVEAIHLIQDLLEMREYLVYDCLLLGLSFHGVNALCVTPEIVVCALGDKSTDLNIARIKPWGVRKMSLSRCAVWHFYTRPP